MKITVSSTVNASLSQVWGSYSNPADVLRWNAASDDWHTTRAEVDFREGGRFCSRMEAKDGSFGFDFEGVYTKIIPGELIEYEFGKRLAQVEFKVVADGVYVQLTFDAEQEFPVEQQQQGWQAILDRFKRYVESK